jgi:hypothetical protein
VQIGSTNDITWNKDFLLASMWQLNDDPTTMFNYCSHLHGGELSTGTPSVEFTAANYDTSATPVLKFDGKHKCSFMFWTTDNSMGLAFKVT